MLIFKLFACCIPVKGFKNKIICDLQRNEFINIPDALYEILTSHKNKSISEIKNSYDMESHHFIDEYFVYLENNEFGFWTDIEDVKNFPDLDLKFESPELINNAIIDIDENSNHNYTKIFNELEKLRCKFIEIRSFNNLNINELFKILELTSNKIFRNIDIILKYYDTIEHDIKSSNLISIFTNIGVISVHSSPKDKKIDDNIIFTKKHVNSCNDCGEIKLKNFSLDIQTFSEAQHFNTCLNKKVAIDSKGNIKNCPAFIKSYGNINNSDSISDIIKSQDFTSFWGINKNQIKICNDCEYRYICTDCRAFVDDIFDKPKKCNYNPYDGIWE